MVMSECDKWSKVHSKAILLNEFYEFLGSKQIILCNPSNNSMTDFPYTPTLTKFDDLIYEFFGIDYNRLDKERREMLQEIQQRNKSQRNISKVKIDG